LTRVIVHAGFHKTGTSSLQTYLDQNRATLAPWFAYYGQKEFLDAGAHARVYAQRRFWWRRQLFRRALRRFLTTLPDAPVIVLSRENFSGVMPGHRGWFGTPVLTYPRAAIPLARDIIAALKTRFGPEVQIEFLYTLRDQESWLNSVHGHLLRSIRLTQSFNQFVQIFADTPDLRQQSEQIARAIAPVPVRVAWLEDYADEPQGPAAAILDLAGVPDEQFTTLPHAAHRNVGQTPDIRKKFLDLNRNGGTRRALRRAKQAVQKSG